MRGRAIWIYILTIVAPAAALVWLGIQTFERQRLALTALTSEKVAAEVETRLRTAAAKAIAGKKHPVVTHFFTMERGLVVQPSLRQPPPLPSPIEFLEAERLELALDRPDLALAAYRKLMDAHQHESLALSRIARCLSKIGRHEEARATWRLLVSKYPDECKEHHGKRTLVGEFRAGESAMKLLLCFTCWLSAARRRS